MNTIIKNVITSFAILLISVNPAFATVVGNQNQNLTVTLDMHEISVPVNTSVTLDANIANNLNRKDRVTVTLTVISPSGATKTSQEIYLIPGNGSIITQYFLAAGPEIGQYTVIVSAKDIKGASTATIYFSTF